MRPSSVVIVIAILFASFGHAQNPAPTVTYLLHAKSPTRANDLSLTPVGAAPVAVLAATSYRSAVLALIPQASQWCLKMVTEWNTSSPQEKTLTFEGNEPLDKADYVTASMTPSPDGKFVLVRLLAFHPKTLTREAVVLLINLESFAVVWRRISSDPLIANSRWYFSDQGALIAAVGPPATKKGGRYSIFSDVMTMNPSTIGAHSAARLSFPDLQPSLFCRYNIASGPFDTGPQSKSALPETDTCSALLEVAGLDTEVNLPGPSNAKDVKTLGGPSCELVKASEETSLALYSCQSGRALEDYGFIVKTREVKVLSIVDGGVDLSLSLPPKEATSSTLSFADGHDYLLLLRDGTKLEAYMLR